MAAGEEAERLLFEQHPGGQYIVSVRSREVLHYLKDERNQISSFDLPDWLQPTCIHCSQYSEEPFYVLGGASSASAFYCFGPSKDEEVINRYLYPRVHSPVTACWTGRAEAGPDFWTEPVYMCVLGHHNGAISILMSAGLEDATSFAEADICYQETSPGHAPVRFLSFVGGQLLVIRQDATVVLYNATFEMRETPTVVLRSFRTLRGPGPFGCAYALTAPSEKPFGRPEDRVVVVFWGGQLHVYTGLGLTPHNLDAAQKGIRNPVCCSVLIGEDPAHSLLMCAGASGAVLQGRINMSARPESGSLGNLEGLSVYEGTLETVPCGIGMFWNQLVVVAPRRGKLVNIPSWGTAPQPGAQDMPSVKV